MHSQISAITQDTIEDALGMPTEGMTQIQIIQHHKLVYDYGAGRPGSPNEKLKAGQYTDDTEQTLILARSIIESGTFDPKLFLKNVKRSNI